MDWKNSFVWLGILIVLWATSSFAWPGILIVLWATTSRLWGKRQVEKERKEENEPEERKEQTETEEEKQATHAEGRKEETEPKEETDSDRIFSHFRMLQNALHSAFESTAKQERNFGASSSKPPLEEIVPPGAREINEHVYEVTNLSGRRPSIELVFFHGLQLQPTHEPHLDTWLSADGTQLWLNWIIQEFPDARILTVKYDAHPLKTDTRGRMDMYLSTENLLQCLVKAPAEVGKDGCPVILVGHCVGGLIMKQLCVYANSKVFRSSDRFGKSVQKFLKNVKGLFFYATPHHGTELADLFRGFSRGLLLKDLTLLNKKGSRQNEEFRVLRANSGWTTFGVAESRETVLGEFRGIIVEEASARYDVDGLYTADANHFDVCRASSSTSSSFSMLSNFITSRIEEGKARCSPKVNFTDEVVGLDNQVARVQNQLKNRRRLGIVGMGGIGKTTLAKTVYNTISGNYDYTCFVGEAKRHMNKEENPDELRRKIEGNLFANEDKVDNTFTWIKLKGKKVLIVLDDVVSAAQVKVMTDEDGFSNGSRLIVTSRDRGFLTPEDFEFYDVTVLADLYSKQMLCINAFKQIYAPKKYEDVVATVVKKCAGFPLAIKIVGRYLYKRPMEIWNGAITRLSNAKALDGKAEDELWSFLRVGYDDLQKDEQEMFLDVATIFHGEDLDEVKHMWIKYLKYDDLGWMNLVERGFVTEVRGDKSNKDRINIQMHEVLRDLGRSIAGDSRLHYKISRGNIPRWPFQSQGNPRVKVLKISFEKWVSWEPVKFNEIRLLRNLGELRLLWIQGGVLYGPCNFFPQELVYVKIERVSVWSDSTYGKQDSQETEPHQQLRHLEIRNAGFYGLPRSLGHLQALEHLNISDCEKLNCLPEELGQLTALEHLTIWKCGDYEDFFDLPATLVNLRKLKHLSVTGSRSKTKLEWDYVGQLEALEHLSLKINAFPKSVLNLRQLKCLCIQGIEDDALPNNFGELRALVELEISYCHNLEALPDSLCELAVLKDLDIFECRGLRSLPRSLGHLTALRRLKVALCPIDVVPESLWDIQGLEDLTLSVKVLPDTLEKLQSLKHLCLTGGTFNSVPDTIGQLEALEELELVSCFEIRALPDTIGQLKGLKRLVISECHLEFLPGSIGGLHALESARLHDCDLLGALPDSLGLLHALKSLIIENCNKLKALPHTLGQLRSLEELDIYYCGNLRALPDSLGQLECLERLRVVGCFRVYKLPASLKLILGNVKRVELDRWYTQPGFSSSSSEEESGSSSEYTRDFPSEYGESSSSSTDTV